VKQLADLADDYLRYLTRNGRQPGTLKAYRWALDGWLLAMERLGVADPGELTQLGLEAWQDELASRGLAARTRGIAVAAVRGMLRWAAGRERGVPPMLWAGLDTIRAPRLLPRPLSPVALDRIIAALTPRPRRTDLCALRDRALFFYLVSTGARISEALQVDRDVYGRMVVVRQKGGAQKVLMSTPVADDAVADYLRCRPDNHPALFITHDTNRPVRRLDATGAREVWIRLARRLGVPRFTTHQLRHTAATEMMDAGVPDLIIAEQLGHRRLDTLRGYAQVREARRAEAVRAMQDRLTMTHGEVVPLPRRRRRPA
jgi:integrase/recombinase XerD